MSTDVNDIYATVASLPRNWKWISNYFYIIIMHTHIMSDIPNINMSFAIITYHINE